MVEKLHRMVFKALLWMCPFEGMDTPACRLLTTGINPKSVARENMTDGFLLGDETEADSPMDRPAAMRW